MCCYQHWGDIFTQASACVCQMSVKWCIADLKIDAENTVLKVDKKQKKERERMKNNQNKEHIPRNYKKIKANIFHVFRIIRIKPRGRHAKQLKMQCVPVTRTETSHNSREVNLFMKPVPDCWCHAEALMQMANTLLMDPHILHVRKCVWGLLRVFLCYVCMFRFFSVCLYSPFSVSSGFLIKVCLCIIYCFESDGKKVYIW